MYDNKCEHEFDKLHAKYTAMIRVPLKPLLPLLRHSKIQSPSVCTKELLKNFSNFFLNFVRYICV